MKKTLFISALAISTLIACKKDYTCTCTVTNTKTDREIVELSNSIVYNGKEDDVTAICELGNNVLDTLKTTCTVN